MEHKRTRVLEAGMKGSNKLFHHTVAEGYGYLPLPLMHQAHKSPYDVNFIEYAWYIKLLHSIS